MKLSTLIRSIFIIGVNSLVLVSCGSNQDVRVTEDFNFSWKFHLGDISGAEQPGLDETGWEDVRLPHDWSILAGYQQENTAASTGFVPGGVGWYRKSFQLPESDRDREIWIEFDGIYCNSDVWINGQHLGKRPNGYSSFSYPLSDHLHFGNSENVIAVRADHSAYADTRWYTGSGIYRNVRLVKTSPIHIPQWGVQIQTEEVSVASAIVKVRTEVENPAGSMLNLEVEILDPRGRIVAYAEGKLEPGTSRIEQALSVQAPALWSINAPNLYSAKISLFDPDHLVDEVVSNFGIRFFEFDPEKGFSLNGVPTKIKGVNIHHDAGAVGAAVSKSVWEYRVGKLKSIGTNAIRMAHNPHSPELIEVCDEMGMLVMNEFFDEWFTPKLKNKDYIGDKAAPVEASKGYSDYFHTWAERDLKDLIRRDFNHPSVIMWSIGNEIEWTFPAYVTTYNQVNNEPFDWVQRTLEDPDYIGPMLKGHMAGADSLALTAIQLASWVREMDNSRPVTCGSVMPLISITSDYGSAVDVLGFNYRSMEYDVAHELYPDMLILGTENHGSWDEWKNIKERDFVSGIFAWTGFAYLGEAGPWPRKGLEISFFDFAGFKTPRGHFYECLWKEEPKVYMVTTPLSESEYSYTDDGRWHFEMQYTKPPVWKDLRKWEWYSTNEHWNYKDDEEIVVQVYTNAKHAELFLNGTSLGKQAREDFQDDNIIKWLVPFSAGALSVKAYDAEDELDEYKMHTTGELASIELSTEKAGLLADGYDVAFVEARMYDDQGHLIRNLDTEISFLVEGGAELLAVDNGWEMNVESHYRDKVLTHNGRAVALIRANESAEPADISASIGDIKSNELEIPVK